MKKLSACLLIIAMALMFAACNQDDGDVNNTETVPNEGATVLDITFKGDDSASNLSALWAGIENDGTAGANIDLLLKYPDNRDLKTVVISVGLRNLADGETADAVIQKFIEFYAAISAERKICVGIAPVYGSAPYDSKLWMPIWKFNQAMAVVCGESNYVETWDIEHSSDNGVYPNATMNALIKARIDELIVNGEQY